MTERSSSTSVQSAQSTQSTQSITQNINISTELSQKAFRVKSPLQYLASKIEHSFANANWMQDGFDYVPLNVKMNIKDIILNRINIENLNLDLIVATMVIVYKMLYDNEQNQKLFGPKTLTSYPNLNMIRSMKNQICTSYSLPMPPLNETDIYFNNLPEEMKRNLMSTMYDFVYDKVIKALGVSFVKKDDNVQYKYYATVYRYIVYLLKTLN